jgi:hypothetical protein
MSFSKLLWHLVTVVNVQLVVHSVQENEELVALATSENGTSLDKKRSKRWSFWSQLER